MLEKVGRFEPKASSDVVSDELRPTLTCTDAQFDTEALISASTELSLSVNRPDVYQSQLSSGL